MDHPLHRFLFYRLRVGRVAGIDVNLHWSMLLLAVFFLFIFRFDLRLGVLVVMALFGSVFLHECGHCFAARKMGGDAREMILWPLGGLAMVHAPMTPWPQFVVAVCGPLVNVALVAVTLPLFLIVGGEVTSLFSFALPLGAGLGVMFLMIVLQINAIMAFFNLIPAFPMDGGRILHTALWPKLGFHKALNVAIICAIVCASAMVVIGLWTRDLFLAFIGLAIVFVCLQERRKLQYGGYDEELAMASPWAASLPNYDGLGYAGHDVDDDGEPKQSKLAQWREKRRQKREEEELQRRAELRARLDEVLAKVSADGLDSLTREERRFLDHASAELRKEQEQP